MKMFKYTLKIQDMLQQVEMALDAEIKFVHEQNGQICLWAKVTPEAALRCRIFWVVGTGHDIPSASKYVGTAKVGEFVWHVFEAI